MKYLKSFNEGKQIEEILTIKEILLELNDLGIYTTVDWTPITKANKEHSHPLGKDRPNELLVDIQVSEKPYDFENYKFYIEECVLRIKNYMKSQGWKVGLDTSYKQLNPSTFIHLVGYQLTFIEPISIKENRSYNYDIEQDLKDILLEIEDIGGFDIKYDNEANQYGSLVIHTIKIYIRRNNHHLLFKNRQEANIITDTLLRIRDYLYEQDFQDIGLNSIYDLLDKDLLYNNYFALSQPFQQYIRNKIDIKFIKQYR